MNSLNPIRIMIVDDQQTVRYGLTIGLAPFDDLELVGEAASGIEAVQIFPTIKPDVILMDLIMPRMGGVEAITKIKHDCPEAKIIVLTTFKNDKLLEAAFKAGASGYLLKDVSIDEMANAIRMTNDPTQANNPATSKALKNLSGLEHRIDPHRAKSPAKILYIDDDQFQRKVVSHILTKHGFEVRTAVDGQQGVALAFTWVPDLILMDILMPVMDGFEATKSLASSSITRHIPIIIYSNVVDEQLEAQMSDIGASDFLQKTNLPGELLHKIEQYLPQ